jgi:hypothetical protein
LVTAGWVVAGIVGVLVVGWLVLVLPGVLAHEIGHLLLGRLLGYRLYRFAIWPYVWDLIPKRGIRFDRKSSNYPGMGYVIMFPDAWPCKVRGHVMFLLGGLFANLALALICVGLGQIWRWWYFGAIGPTYFLICGIAAIAGKDEISSDLRRVVAWVKESSEESALLATHKLIFLFANGGNPSDADWREALQLKGHPRLRLWLYLNGVNHSIGSEREARFRKFEHLLLEFSDPDFAPHKWRLAIDGAYLALVSLCDRGAAKRLIPSGDPPSANDLLRLRRVNLLLMVSEGIPGVEEDWQEFVRALEKIAPDPGLNLIQLNYVRFAMMPLLAESEVLAKLVADRVRPREWNEGEICALISSNSNGNFGAFVQLMAYFWLMDLQRVEEARQSVERGLEILAGISDRERMIAYQLALEAAFVRAVFDRDGEGAMALIQELDDEPLLRVERLRTEAAIAMARGSVKSGRSMIEEALRLLRSEPAHIGSREDSFDLLEWVSRMPD